MTDPTHPPCPNCGSEKADVFCPECGQDQRDVRVSFGRWLVDLLDEQLSLNSRLPRTLGLLAVRPGFLTAEWLEGRRTRYTPPLRLYILASIVFFSVTFFMGLPFGGLQVELGELGTEIASTPQELAGAAISGRMQGFLTLGAALAVPLLALWLKLLRRRSKRFFIDHLVFSLHLHSLALFALTVSYALLFFGPIGQTGAAVVALYVFAYWAVAWWRTYRPEKGVMRSLWSLCVASAGWGALILGIAIGEGAAFGSMVAVSWNVGPKAYGTSLFLTARERHAQGDTLRARVYAEQAIVVLQAVDSTYRHRRHDYFIAELLRMTYRYEEALDSAQRLISEDAGDLLALGLAGAVAEAVGDSTAARTYYLQLLEDPLTSEDRAEDRSPTLNRYVASARAFLRR